LVGVRRISFAWQAATGQPTSYYVSRSVNGGPLQSYTVTNGNSVLIPVVPGDQIQISVRAAGVDSTGAIRIGPESPLSDPVKVLPAPQYPAVGQWLMRCAACQSMQLRSLADASVTVAAASALPAPWVVLGHANMAGGETIVWHNPATGQLAVWDWESLAPL